MAENGVIFSDGIEKDFLEFNSGTQAVIGIAERKARWWSERMKTILILEDNDERIAAFQKTVAALGGGFELKIWRDAPSMIAECEAFFPTAALIWLDHDLNPQPGATADPGTGLDVAQVSR